MPVFYSPRPYGPPPLINAGGKAFPNAVNNNLS